MLTPAVFEDMAVMKQAASKLYFGQVRASRELSQVLLDTASREKRNQAIADLERNIALDEALVGRIERARQNANASLRLGGEPGMALALIGDAAHASKIAEKWTSRTSKGDDANGIWVPELRATVELKRGNAMRAVELLVPMERYEAGWVDSYMAAYLRGQAYLAAQRGDEAASEFQKILVHRGVVLSSLIGPLSFVGLARAYTLQGDAPKARAAYQDFLTLWKDADPDIPIYKQAKAEYARLQ